MQRSPSTPLLGIATRKSWRTSLLVSAATCALVVVCVWNLQNAETPKTILLQKDEIKGRKSKLSSVFTAPLELAKTKMDDALKGPSPCVKGATSLSGYACEGSPDPLNVYVANAIHDVNYGDCEDCGGDASGGLSDGDVGIEATYEALKKKLHHMKEEFRLTRANFEHGEPKVVHIDIKPRGPRGFTGYPGNVGKTGAPGKVGARGPVGHKGQDGPRGLQGDKGRQGAKGMTGSIGKPGIMGVEGPKGATGAEGYPGPKGPRGLPGAPGVNGANGADGVPGAQGPDGAVGPPGPQGDPGPPGKSGKAGDNGPAGPAGPAGTTGESGASGPPGPAGAQGADGVGPPKPKPMAKARALGKCYSADTKCKQLGVKDNLCGQCFGADWRFCADNGMDCACHGMVRYGTQGKWTEEKFVDGKMRCSTLSFGEDPAEGDEKWCECAHGFMLVNEDALEYKGKSFDDKNFGEESVQAQNVCLLARYGNEFHNEEKECAKEGDTCQCDGNVRYGGDGNYAKPRAVKGSIACTNAAFKFDPNPGKDKACYCSSGSYPYYPSKYSFGVLKGSGDWKRRKGRKSWNIFGRRDKRRSKRRKAKGKKDRRRKWRYRGGGKRGGKGWKRKGGKGWRRRHKRNKKGGWRRVVKGKGKGKKDDPAGVEFLSGLFDPTQFQYYEEQKELNPLENLRLLRSTLLVDEDKEEEEEECEGDKGCECCDCELSTCYESGTCNALDADAAKCKDVNCKEECDVDDKEDFLDDSGKPITQTPHFYGGCSADDKDEKGCCLNSELITPGTNLNDFAEGSTCVGNTDESIPWECAVCLGVTNEDTEEAPPPKAPPPPPKKAKSDKDVDPKDTKNPPAEAKLFDGSGKSLLNMHCASWRDKASTWHVTKQKRFMAKCMAQDCVQSLEKAGGGCRFMDDNRLCYAYSSAQQWCAEHQSNINCHDGEPDWALPPVGNFKGDQYNTKWVPKNKVPVRNPRDGDDKEYDCTCLKNCTCSKTTCRCVDKETQPVGGADDLKGKRMFRSSSKKGMCGCSCGGVLGQ